MDVLSHLKEIIVEEIQDNLQYLDIYKAHNLAEYQDDSVTTCASYWKQEQEENSQLALWDNVCIQILKIQKYLNFIDTKIVALDRDGTVLR